MKVELGELADRIDEYGFAYLVTVGEDSRAHLLAVLPELVDGGLVIGGVGRHSIANVDAKPAVTLVWPPPDAGGFSLIVDGEAKSGDGAITVTPTKAILHRPATDDVGRRTGSDCQPISPSV